MRAVIIGTDFIKDTDGSFKAIETNTNVGLAVPPSRYFNLDDFTQFVEDNNFTEIIVIFNNTNNQIFPEGELEPKIDVNKSEAGLPYFIQTHYSGSSISVSLENLNETSVSIPNIEDAESKLIIRIAYDSTALIDDTYARDNWEFLKLMNDANPNLIAKTYINDSELGFDSIGVDLRDNGNQPNYCIKKRITPANNNIYPKLLKISTIEELNVIKNNLESDEYIQEYIFNESDLLNNKLKVYRSVDLVYGSELNSLNLWIVEQSNIMDIIETPDYDDNNEIQIWDRNRYTTKYNSKTSDIAIKFSADAGTKILNSNNEIVLVENLNIDDYVKSISIPGLEANISLTETLKWTGSTDTILNDFSITSSQLISKVMTPYFGEIVEIELNNGTIFSDVPHATILVQQEISGSTFNKFMGYEHLTPETIVFIWDNQTDTIVTGSITEIRYSYQELNAYTLNVNEFDLFLTLEESDGNRFGLITHNYDYDCINYTCGDYSMNDNCANCSDGYYIGNCNYQQGCCRIGGFNSIYNTNNFDPSNINCTVYQYYGWDPYPSCVGTGTYPVSTGSCNGQKPSDTNIKQKIKFIAKTKEDLHIYQFTYNDYIKKLWMEETNENLEGEWYGVLAQELIGTKYESALQKHKEGFYTVNYDKLPKWEIKSGYLIS